MEHDRVDVSKEIDVNKTSASKECDICHCWYFYITNLGLNRMSGMVITILSKIQRTLMMLQLTLLKEMIAEFNLINAKNDAITKKRMDHYDFFLCIKIEQ